MKSEEIGHQGQDPKTEVVEVTPIPDAFRGLDPMANPNYVDLFTATTSGATDSSPEQWARLTLEGTPTGRSAPTLWRLLGLRLGPMPSPDHVQGWKIADRGDGWIRVETSSWYMTGHAVVRATDDDVSLALFLRFDRLVARVIWPPVAILHRRGAPVMVHQAVKSQAAVLVSP